MNFDIDYLQQLRNKNEHHFDIRIKQMAVLSSYIHKKRKKKRIKIEKILGTDRGLKNEYQVIFHFHIGCNIIKLTNKKKSLTNKVTICT